MGTIAFIALCFAGFFAKDAGAVGLAALLFGVAGYIAGYVDANARCERWAMNVIRELTKPRRRRSTGSW